MWQVRKLSSPVGWICKLGKAKVGSEAPQCDRVARNLPTGPRHVLGRLLGNRLPELLFRYRW
jgi:hypothetical protein